MIAFGGRDWLVLAVEGERALVIARDVIELRWYHDAFVNVTWADCALRRHLNDEFYDSFDPRERSRIVAVRTITPDNPWFKTPGGQDAVDKVFLLSLEEVCRYFGDSSERLQRKGSHSWRIADENSHKRRAAFAGEPHWWRLRSPGYYARTSASVSANGDVYVRGNGVHGRPKDGGGVRPALWLKLA